MWSISISKTKFLSCNREKKIKYCISRFSLFGFCKKEIVYFYFQLYKFQKTILTPLADILRKRNQYISKIVKNKIYLLQKNLLIYLFILYFCKNVEILLMNVFYFNREFLKVCSCDKIYFFFFSLLLLRLIYFFYYILICFKW